MTNGAKHTRYVMVRRFALIPSGRGPRGAPEAREAAVLRAKTPSYLRQTA